MLTSSAFIANLGLMQRTHRSIGNTLVLLGYTRLKEHVGSDLRAQLAFGVGLQPEPYAHTGTVSTQSDDNWVSK
jgi:hypothetical protein